MHEACLFLEMTSNVGGIRSQMWQEYRDNVSSREGGGVVVFHTMDSMGYARHVIKWESYSKSLPPSGKMKEMHEKHKNHTKNIQKNNGLEASGCEMTDCLQLLFINTHKIYFCRRNNL